MRERDALHRDAAHTALVAIHIVHACLPLDLLFARVFRCMIGATTSPRVSDEIYDGAPRTKRPLF